MESSKEGSTRWWRQNHVAKVAISSSLLRRVAGLRLSWWKDRYPVSASIGRCKTILMKSQYAVGG
jgi:hypothetical protein